MKPSEQESRIINELKDNVDGESLEYILRQIGMSDQMLVQLIKGANREVVNSILDELDELDGVSAEKRLKFIKDDLNQIHTVLGREAIDPSQSFTSDGTSLTQLLNNISIACDMNETEVKNWKSVS